MAYLCRIPYILQFFNTFDRGDCICGKCKNCKDGASGKYCQTSLKEPLETEIIPCVKNQFFAGGLTPEETAQNRKKCDNITGDKGWFGNNYYTLCMMQEYGYSGMQYKSTLQLFIYVSTYVLLE